MTIRTFVARTLLGLLLLSSLGCQTSKVFRPVAASDLQTRGIVCGSFPGRNGAHAISIRNLDTGEVHLAVGQNPTSGFSKKPEDSEPDPFLLALPAGRYEFYRANTRPSDWCEFEAPFELAAGQILYVGELQLDVKMRAQGNMAGGVPYSNIAALATTAELIQVGFSRLTRDKEKPQVDVIDFLDRDTQILRERHPEIAWQRTENRVSLLKDLTITNPIVGKKQGEIIRLQAQQRKADKAAGIKKPKGPVEEILQR